MGRAIMNQSLPNASSYYTLVDQDSKNNDQMSSSLGLWSSQEKRSCGVLAGDDNSEIPTAVGSYIQLEGPKTS